MVGAGGGGGEGAGATSTSPKFDFIFLISAQKHRLWVLVRTASLRLF